jgi:hypothetical protein
MSELDDLSDIADASTPRFNTGHRKNNRGHKSTRLRATGAILVGTKTLRGKLRQAQATSLRHRKHITP